MRQPKHAAVSLASFRWGRRTLYVLPVRSVIYGLTSLAIVFLVLLVVDRFVLGSLERGGWTAGELWARHNKLVEENHRRKTTAKEDELRQWTGEPLPALDGGRRKILVMGDSFVWGPPYATLNHLWWRQLAIELERRGYRDVDVVAAGQPGWSTRQQLECAKNLIPEVNPNLVIWGYVTNDADEQLVRQISQSQDRPPYGERIRRQLRKVLPNLIFKFESLRADKLANQYAGPEYGYAYFDWELKLLEGENFARYCQTVSDVGALLRESQRPALLLTLPRWPCREHYEPRYAPVLPQWQTAGVQVVNTLDEFIGRYGNAPQRGPAAIQWGINPGDSHPGPKATHFHAVMAADFLEQHWPEVLGTKVLARPHELVINDWMPFDLNVRQVRENMFEFEYPGTTDFMPQPPQGEPAALVALRYPLPLKEIRLEGSGLRSSQIWVSTLDPSEAYDQSQWHELKSASSGSNQFALTGELYGREVTAIRFRALCDRNDRHLRLTLVQSTEERQ